MASSTLSRLRSLLVGLAFLFASVGRSVVDATFYHSDSDDLARRAHIEAIDGNSCHAEACILNVLTAPIKSSPLGANDLRVQVLPASEAVNRLESPPRSSLRLEQPQPRAPPARS
jgi:hypothetical protein